MNVKHRLSKAQLEDAARQAKAETEKIVAVWSMSELERTRFVWKSLADYVNADLNSGREGFEALHAAARVLLLYTHENSSAERILKGSGHASFLSDAIHYQGHLRNLFVWLCNPKTNPDLRKPALQFLESQAHGERWHIDLDDDWTEMEFEEQRGPASYFTKQVQFKSIMVLVCKFILNQVDPPPAEGLTVRICKRPGCGKFYVRERRGKQYCSDSCRAADHQSPDARRDYQYVHRLEQTNDLGLLRVKLRSPAVQNRLAAIEKTAFEEHWDWAVEKIKRIRER